MAERTLSEAKKFLNDILSQWESNKQSQKIVKLAKWAEKWTVSKDKEDKDKMKILYTSVNQTKAQIKRDESLGMDITDIQQKLEVYESNLADLEKTYGKYIPPKPKKKVKNVIE